MGRVTGARVDHDRGLASHCHGAVSLPDVDKEEARNMFGNQSALPQPGGEKQIVPSREGGKDGVQTGYHHTQRRDEPCRGKRNALPPFQRPRFALCFLFGFHWCPPPFR